jgi:hypothetical protein
VQSSVVSSRDFVLQRQKVVGPPYIATWNWRLAKASVAILAQLKQDALAGGHGILLSGPRTAEAVRAFAERLEGQ